MVSDSLTSPVGPRRPGAIATFGLGFAIQLAAGLAGLSVLLLSSLLFVGLGPISLVEANDLFQEYEEASRIAREVMDVGYLSHGLLLSLSILAAVPAGVFIIRLVASLYDASPRVFLGLRWPTARQALAWLAAIVALRYGLMALLDWLGSDGGGGTTIDRYRTASSLPLLFLAVTVAGPIFEEVLFRGFLLEGWRRTRLGTVGATVLTAALWALCHSYAAPMIALIFCDGIVLAMARLRTGSTYLTIVMHGLLNLLVLIHVGFFLANHGSEYFLERGREHLGKEQYWEAFLAFREAERYTNGPCAECQVGLAQAYLGSGKPQGAVRAATLARQVLESKPQANLERRARVLLCLSQSKTPLPRPFSSEDLQPTEPLLAEGPVQGTGGVYRPRLLRYEEPVYPETAPLDRHQGSVIVESAINQDGCVTEARVLRGTTPDLDAAALDAVHRWVFQPATFQGRPVKVYYSVTINFQRQ